MTGREPPPGAARMLRELYWRCHRRRDEVPHLLAALGRGTLLSRRLRRRPGGRPLVTIALTEHMGDIIAAEPVAREARRRFPGAVIRWVVRHGYASLPAGYDGVDEVVPVACLTEWLCARCLGVPGEVWDLHVGGGRACPRCAVSLPPGGAAARVTFETYYLLGNLLTAQCLNAGIPPLTEAPRLPPNRAAATTVDDLGLPSSYVVIHAASNDARRDWPRASWAALTETLMREHGVPVVEVGLEGQGVSAPGPLRRDLCGRLSIPQTAEVIRRARLFIGIDSGPAHLGNAVGTPAVLLFGSFAGFDRYMPYSGFYEHEGGAQFLWSDGPASDLTVAAVLTAVLERLHARP